MGGNIILNNVVDLTQILEDLIREGYPVNRENVAALSPYLTHHIKRFGELSSGLGEDSRILGHSTTFEPDITIREFYLNPCRRISEPADDRLGKGSYSPAMMPERAIVVQLHARTRSRARCLGFDAYREDDITWYLHSGVRGESMRTKQYIFTESETYGIKESL